MGRKQTYRPRHNVKPTQCCYWLDPAPVRPVAISWMGIAASFGREKGKHESGASVRPPAISNSLSRVETAQTQFVGDSNHGLVVSPRAVDLPSPGAELVGRALADVRRAEHGAPALGEEHTEVGVATLGDASEAANVATGVFLVRGSSGAPWERRRSPTKPTMAVRPEVAGNEKSLDFRNAVALSSCSMLAHLSLSSRISQASRRCERSTSSVS